MGSQAGIYTNKERERNMKTAFLGTLFMLAAAPVFAAVTIGSGSAINFADGTVHLGCSDLIIDGTGAGSAATIDRIASLAIDPRGTLAPGGSTFSLGGNFIDAGIFAAATSRIAIVDACGSGTSQISGSASFYDFVVATGTGKGLVLPAGITQSVEHALTLQGVSSGLLQITSSMAGQQALLNVATSAAQTIAYVNARDNRASGATIATGPAANYQSVDGGNLLNWFANAVLAPGSAAVPVPLLNPYGFITLLLALSLGACFARRPARLRQP